MYIMVLAVVVKAAVLRVIVMVAMMVRGYGGEDENGGDYGEGGSGGKDGSVGGDDWQ